MKIALVSPYDFAYPGGVVNHIVMLERHLILMGHQVKIIAPASQAVDSHADRFIQIGKPRTIPVSGTIARITISLRLAHRIKEVLAREKFDIIHLHEPFMVMLCSAVLRFSDTVNIGTFHATQGRPGYNWGWPIGRYMLKRRSRKLHGMIAVSPPAKEYASRYVSGDFEIIPNGIELDRFTSDVSSFEEYSDGKLNILFVGRLEGRKGLSYLIEAYKKIKNEFPDTRLIVVGPGSRPRRRYEKQVKQGHLKDIAFTGRVSDEELARYYKTADIYCTPATGQESFGIVLLEAMAMGTPIVASDIPGYASVMRHGKEGLLVPPKDVVGLAETLRTLLIDKSLRQRLGTNGLATAAKYSWELVARRIVAYYHKVLEETSPVEPAVVNKLERPRI